MPRFDFDDDDVVVVVGSGAGGGTLANELCQGGAKTVVLEAGKHHQPDEFIDDEWPSFNQLAWLDERTTSGSWRVAKDFPSLPAWTCKTVGGTTTHWAGCCPRFKDWEFRIRSEHGPIDGAMATRRRLARAPSAVAAPTAVCCARLAVPRQPTWASASVPASSSQSVTARQSAVKIASGTPRVAVDSTSTAPLTPPRRTSCATSAPWT